MVIVHLSESVLHGSRLHVVKHSPLTDIVAGHWRGGHLVLDERGSDWKSELLDVDSCRRADQG